MCISYNESHVCDGPRAQPGRGAMWRSGAPQRRGARGARRAPMHITCCYTKCESRRTEDSQDRSRAHSRRKKPEESSLREPTKKRVRRPNLRARPPARSSPRVTKTENDSDGISRDLSYQVHVSECNGLHLHPICIMLLARAVRNASSADAAIPAMSRPLHPNLHSLKTINKETVNT